MKRAAGIPFPETSAIITPTRLLSIGITSRGTTSKKSPPTSFAITLFAATSNPGIGSIVSGRKLCWISAAMASSVSLRSISRSRVSRSACIFLSFWRFSTMKAKTSIPTALATIMGIEIASTRARAWSNGRQIARARSMCRPSIRTRLSLSPTLRSRQAISGIACGANGLITPFSFSDGISGTSR